tara:strand:- start:335 stop:1324 length:990 start_codon:yes stop_codon:yes gene_type:complete
MGIKGLTSLINKQSPSSIQTTSLYTLSGKTVAVDTSIFLYKSLANVRHNGEYLRNNEGKVVSHIIGLFNKTIQYLSLGIVPIYIFDGKPPIEKQTILDERNKKAKESKELFEKSENKEEKNKYEKNSIRIKKYHIDDLKSLFNLMGVSYIHADGEAEVYASELCRIGYVDYVVSEDMDTLASGCPKMIRSCLDRSIKRNDVVSIINLEQVLKDFEMNMNQFLDICILSGCDYCPITIPKVGSLRSYNYIKTYKTIEGLIESNKCLNIPQEFLDKYKISRDLLQNFKDKIDPQLIPIHISKYDKNKLIEYLRNNCSMSEKKIETAIKKIV